MAVPKLRFKADDGSDYPDLVEIKIGDVIKEAKRPLDMEDDEKYQLVTVKRRNEGIVSRGMFYGRDILVKNYYTVKKGDYIISKRQVIHGANGIVPPELDDAIVSNEYMVLTDSSTLLVNYLALYSMTKKMYHIFYISSYGVDIEKMFFNVDDWKKKKIMVPCIKEQQKVVELFSLIDTVIEKQKETVSAWEERKKGVMQKLFSQEVRFKADDGSDFPEWEEKKLKNILKEYKEYSAKDGSYEHVSLTKEGVVPKSERYERDFLVKDVDKKYRITHLGDICYNPANLKFGVICRNKYGDGIFSPIYVTFKVCKDMVPEFVEMLVTRRDFIEYALKYQQGTVYERMSVSPDDLLSIKVMVPSVAEQQKIADCFSSLDEVIEKQKATLAAWEEMKKGLLQQMFV